MTPPKSINGLRPPFALASNAIFFHDWRYIDHSYFGWIGPGDAPVPLMPAPDPLPPIHTHYRHVPHGVRIQTMPCRFDAEPVLTARQLKEPILMNGSVLYEDGLYRLYYASFDADAMFNPDKKGMIGFTQSLRYAESENGTDWRFPSVGEPAGKEGFHNSLFRPARGLHGPCVFQDESAPPEERYKAFFMGMASDAEFKTYRDKFPDDIDPMAVIGEASPLREHMAAYAMYGAVSPDGLSWQVLEEPMLIQHSDTFQACTFNALSSEYIAYLRSWPFGRRAIAIATSKDFRHFGNLRQVLWPAAEMAPCETWYTPGYTTMPDSTDYHMMFATRWSQQDDEFAPFLHASPDGHLWSRVPGDVLPPHEDRPAWSRCGFALSTLNPLPGDRVGSLVGGWHVPHKYPRRSPFGQLGWAWWQRDRITALRAERDGHFWTYPLRFHGREIVLNYRTRGSGSIRVGVSGIAGREITDCDWISGDEMERVVSWKGVSDMGHAEGEPVQLEIEMQNADLFSIRFR